MDNKILNEKESLAIITEMIQNSKRNVSKNAGGPALIWGYATVITSLIVYFGWVFFQIHQIFWCWFLIPISGSIGMYLMYRNGKPVLVKTFLDKVINYIWLVIGLTGFVVSMLNFLHTLPILFMVSLLMGIGITLTGCVTQSKIYTSFGVAGIISSFGCLFIYDINQILYFAFIFLLMMIIPGHLMNIKPKSMAHA